MYVYVCVGEARPMCDHGREVSHCNATDRPGTRYPTARSPLLSWRHRSNFPRCAIPRCSAVAWNEQKLAVMRTYRDRFAEETRSLSRVGRKTRTNNSRVFDPYVDATTHTDATKINITCMFDDSYFVRVDSFSSVQHF